MFKKILFLSAIAFFTLASQAQNDVKVGIWYGVNSSSVKTAGDSPSSALKVLLKQP